MKKLLKMYGLTDVAEYYEVIMCSYVNNQNMQCIEQFNAMPLANQKDMVLRAIEEEYSAFNPSEKRAFITFLIENIYD